MWDVGLLAPSRPSRRPESAGGEIWVGRSPRTGPGPSPRLCGPSPPEPGAAGTGAGAPGVDEAGPPVSGRVDGAGPMLGALPDEISPPALQGRRLGLLGASRPTSWIDLLLEQPG